MKSQLKGHLLREVFGAILFKKATHSLLAVFLKFSGLRTSLEFEKNWSSQRAFAYVCCIYQYLQV